MASTVAIKDVQLCRLCGGPRSDVDRRGHQLRCTPCRKRQQRERLWAQGCCMRCGSRDHINCHGHDDRTNATFRVRSWRRRMRLEGKHL